MSAATVSARSVRTLRILFGLVIAYTLVLLYLVFNARYAESDSDSHLQRLSNLFKWKPPAVADELSGLITVHDPLHHAEASHEYKFNSGLGGYKWYSESTLRTLAACTARGDCHPNAHKVAIFGAIHCHLAMFDNYHGGEGVWCAGMIHSLRKQGYTVLLARNDWDYIWHLYRQIPEQVKVIIGDPEAGGNTYLNFIKSDKRPNGFPAWKFFFFYYFPAPFSTIVGNKWVVTSEPPQGNWDTGTYLGYALEQETNKPIVPFNQRPYRVYVLGKCPTYFYDTKGRQVWDLDFFERVTKELREEKWPDFEIVAGMRTDCQNEEQIKKDGAQPVPAGVRNFGALNATEFDELLGSARLLLGLGSPGLSPSPYRALGRGLPFLNPTWDNGCQHSTMSTVGEPYVYNVPERNFTAFKEAIIRAMESPIEPWVAPWMTQESMDKRMDDFMNHDWRSDAALILEERKKGNETQRIVGERAGKLGLFEL